MSNREERKTIAWSLAWSFAAFIWMIIVVTVMYDRAILEPAPCGSPQRNAQGMLPEDSREQYDRVTKGEPQYE